LPLDELNQQIEELYNQSCCDHHEIEFDVNLADDLSTALEEMLYNIWHLQGTDGNINETITKFFADKIWKGVVKGYGMDIPAVDYDSPDYHMLEAIKKNVWQFSSAKNYAQLRELSSALIGDDGQLRTFDQFKQAARLINDKFMKTWLRTEYDLAVSGGQMAGKWVQIQKNASSLPLLQFDAVIDSQTTDLCRSLDGVTVPINHPFVKRYYPPNHFGCRLTVRQLASGVVTPDNKIPAPEIPKMFQTNLGQQGLIFPEDHAYFIGLPDEIKNQFKG
jgi:SPP1 gp7 family putative phage head morphogenesis protein